MHGTCKWAILACLVLLQTLAPAPQAGVLTLAYPFKTGQPIDIRESDERSFRLDAVQFDLPGTGFLGSGLGASLHAQIAVTNRAEIAQRVGVAIALFDCEGRLLGVASGGSKMMAIKPGQQKFYTLDFEHVMAEAHKATRFQISLESR